MATVMLSFDEALACLTAHVKPIGNEMLSLAEAGGRVLATPVYARRSSPPAAVAAMDGYAVRDGSLKLNMPLRVIGESRAGSGYGGEVGAGEAVRIFTGAKMPVGTDRCVMQEYATCDGDTVRFQSFGDRKWHVRPAGSDFCAGDLLVDRGTVMGPRALVAAAAADVNELCVARQPRVAIIGTGDELVAPGSGPQQADVIPESVTFGVAAMVGEAGGRVVEKVLAKDDLAALSALAARLVTVADIVVVTGGASVGDRDFAKAMFAQLGIEFLFTKVAIKPGKPVWLGRVGDCWILGLPGNPTSAMVTATLFLKPLLAALQGSTPLFALGWRRMTLAGPLEPTGDRETFALATWKGAGLVPTGKHDSGAQAALVNADWLIRCPADAEAAEAGGWVNALRF